MSRGVYIFVLHIDKSATLIIIESMVKINPQPIIKTFGRATQQDIAKSVGVSRPTIYKWLSGDMLTVDLEVLGKLIVACDAAPGDFFTVDAPTGTVAPPPLAVSAPSAPPLQDGAGQTAA